MNCKKAGRRGGSGRCSLCLQVWLPPRTLGEEWSIIVIRSSESVSLDTEEGWVVVSPQVQVQHLLGLIPECLAASTDIAKAAFEPGS